MSDSSSEAKSCDEGVDYLNEAIVQLSDDDSVFSEATVPDSLDEAFFASHLKADANVSADRSDVSLDISRNSPVTLIKRRSPIAALRFSSGSNSSDKELSLKYEYRSNNRKEKPLHNLDKRTSSSSSDDEFDNYLTVLRTPATVRKKTPPTDTVAFIVSDDHSSDADSDTGNSSHAFYLRGLHKSPPQGPQAETPAVFVEAEDKENEAPFERQPLSRSPSMPAFHELNEFSAGVMTSDGPKKSKTKNTKPVVQRGRMKTYSSASSAEDELADRFQGLNVLAVPSSANSRPIKAATSEWKSTVYHRTQSDAALYSDELFLRSLSPSFPSYKRLVAADEFLGKKFKANRDTLVQRLFKLFNKRVFGNQLDSDMKITWNVRLRKTAGLCSYKRNVTQQRSARIELSDKVVDSADRVRDTLIHELCHAAVWVIDGDSVCGHGPRFKYWGLKARSVFSELPVVSRCHNYDIVTKYVYRCVVCGQEVNRHSKSLDTEKKRCGYCRGRFELLVNAATAATPSHGVHSNRRPKQLRTPRPPSKFALFVKENYGSTKKTNQGSSHKEVMELLGSKFKSLGV